MWRMSVAHPNFYVHLLTMWQAHPRNRVQKAENSYLMNRLRVGTYLVAYWLFAAESNNLPKFFQ